MKKIFIFTILYLFFSCSNENNEVKFLNEASTNTNEFQIKSGSLLDNFLRSDTYSRHSSLFQQYGKIDTLGTKTQKIEYQNYEGDYINIPLLNSNDDIVAEIEVVKLERSGCLPNNDSYAINLIDYRQFDFSRKSGNVSMIDVNYDYTHSLISVDDNTVTSWQYNRIQSSPTGLEQPSGIYQLCDGDEDSNISFGECYKCAMDAIEDNGYSNFICDIPVAGWASCWASVSATCVYVSSVY